MYSYKYHCYCYRTGLVSASLVTMVMSVKLSVVKDGMELSVTSCASVRRGGRVTMRLATATTTVPLAGWERYVIKVCYNRAVLAWGHMGR